MDDALKKVTAGGHEVPVVLVYDHARAVPRADVPFTPGRDVWWQDAVEGQPTTCEVEWMGAEDPLFKVRTGSSCVGASVYNEHSACLPGSQDGPCSESGKKLKSAPQRRHERSAM